MNALLFILIIIISFSSLYLFNKFLNKEGLYLWIIIASIISYISSFKIINIFNYPMIASIPIYITIFISVFLLIENYSIKDAKKGCVISLISSIMTTIFLFISISYSPSMNDNISINLYNVFIKNYILYLSYPIILYLSLYFSIKSYELLKKEYKSLIISNMMTLILLGLIDTILISFSLINNIDIKTIIIIIFTNYFLKLIISMIGTLFMSYLTVKKKVKE